MAVRTFLTDRGDTGQRLDLVLCRHLADLDTASRTQVQAWISGGAVTIDGRTVRRTATRVSSQTLLAVQLPDSATAPSPGIIPERIPLDILFEDGHLLAVNKPAGVVVHPTHAHPRETLMNALAWHARDWGTPLRPSIVGRLDKLTSGIVLVAKTARDHASLQREMSTSRTGKDYLALVYGRVPRKEGKIEWRLLRDRVDRRRMTTSRAAGAISLTRYERLAQASVPKTGLALLRCRLFTGRMHQIRAHLAANGWPIVGDPTYGEPRWNTIADHALAEALRAFPRQALHAWRLSFNHPVTAARVEICAPLPPDLAGLLQTLGMPVPP